MKVTCQSCQAKYTIADEKVRGKVAKIRCKKCGTTIIVDGADGGASAGADAPGSAPVADYTQQAGADEQWTVLVADGDQRTLSAVQIADLFASATISYETLVWKDGMGDWTAISDVEALRSVLENGPRPTMTPVESSNGHSVRPSTPPPRSEPAGSLARSKTPEPVAARRPGRGGGADLFGTPAHDDVLTSATESQSPPRGDDKPTGARNENSVLFSLSALTGGGPTPGPSAAAPERDPTSNKADLRALMGSGGGPPAPGKSKIDDIMNLSGGGVYSPGLLASPALAPPPIDFASTAQAGDSGGSKSKSLMMAIVGGVVVVGAVALAFTTMSSKGDTAEKTSGASSSAALATGPRGNAPTAAGNEAPTEQPPGAAARTGEAVRTGETAPAETATGAATAAAPGAVAPGAVAPGAVAPGAAPKVEGDKPVEKRAATTPRAEKPAGATPPPALPPPPVAPPPVAAPAAPAAPAGGGTGDVDRATLMSALGSAATAAQSCKKPDGPTGSGRIAVTFANNGLATTANVEGPPFAGTPVGGCIAARFRSVHIPPFAGSPVTVRKTFIIN